MQQDASRELKRRVEKLQRTLKSKRFDAMIIFGRSNAYYLTGLQASLSYLLVTPREATLLVDGRYYEMACEQVTHCEVRLMKDLSKDLERWQSQLHARRFAFEGDTPWSEVQRWQEAMPGSEWVESGQILRQQRSIKSAAEIRLLTESARINDLMFEATMAAAQPGVTEYELEQFVRAEAERLGADGLGFDAIIAAGPMSSRPHYHPQRRPLQRGDLLLLDMGVQYQGYRSDMTRVVGLGRRPSRRLMQVYEAVLEAEQKAIAAIAPGVACRDVYMIAWETLEKYKMAKYFTHGLGHGVGLDIHEWPRFSRNSDEVLKPGMVVTVEPGVYLPGQGGVRIEDLIVVTRNGHRVISNLPREFRLLSFDEKAQG